jgi:DNA-binding transcriptional regulator YiaG
VIKLELCEILKSIRVELNITQTDLAEAVHVSFSTVNRWENKKVIPNRMARALILDFCEKKGVNRDLIDMLINSK